MFRNNKVAVIFDFDKTLSPSYMQRVVFQHYGIDEKQFWAECQQRSKENIERLGHTHGELDFMNKFLEYTKRNIFSRLNNELLAKLGADIELFPGVPWLMNEIFKLGAEVYIVSSGIRVMLSTLEGRIQELSGNPDFRIAKIYGGDFRDSTDKTPIIESIANCVSPTDKIRAIYEISKGCNVFGFDVTASIPIGSRRIPLENMIYVGDGPSDVPAMNLIHDSGGHTVGVFNPKEPAQFAQIEMIREDNRLDLVAVADYSEGATAGQWILGKVQELVFKSSEEYALRQKLFDLKERTVSHVHPWQKAKYAKEK